MAAIDFGSGAGTATGDTVAQAFAKIQARLDAVPNSQPDPTIGNAVIVGIGDSIMRGLSGDGHIALSQLGFTPTVSVNNRGQDNLTVAQALADVQANSGWGVASGSWVSDRPCIVVFQRGTNDIGAQARTADATYADLSQVVLLYKNQGFYVGAETVLPRYSAWSSAQEAERIKYNNLIRANAFGADFIIDSASDPVIGDSGDLAGKAFSTSYPMPATTYFADGTHLRGPGQDRKAIIYRKTLPQWLVMAPRAKNQFSSGTPAAAFTAQPTVSPSSGTASSTTFNATPGTVSNGSITSRSWKLNGTEISTSTSAAPAASGTLTYQEFATGSGGNASSSIISMTVAAAAATDTTPPVITSANAISQAENSALSLPLTANETVTWSKTGGADAAKFTLSSSTLSLPAQDFETAADADANNTYIVTIRATDTAGNFTDQTITVTITDVNENAATGPAATSRTTAMAYDAGKFGSGGRSAGAVLIPTSAVPATPSYPITFEIWAKTAQTTEGWLMLTDRAAGNNNTWGLLIESSGKMRLTASNMFDQSKQVTTTFVGRDGAWHHYRVRLYSTSIELDVDGVLTAQLAIAPVTGAQMVLGEIYQNAYANTSWNGSFDEFAAFSGARTGAAPTAAYTGSEPNLLALYHFDGSLASGK
jgi:hypothetical protein